jgi:hypothetical protein
MPFPSKQSTGSPSGPPSFRAKKKNPGESDAKENSDRPSRENPKAANANRLTGPPMQQGAGTGSMFADGKAPRGQGQGMPPRTSDYPQDGPGPMRAHGQPQGRPMNTPDYPQRGASPMLAQGMPPRSAPGGMRGPGGPMRPSGPMQGQRPRGGPPAAPFMADGGMGDPGAIGGAPDDQDMSPDMDDSQGGPPMGGGAGEMPVITPEAVNYHDDPQSCAPISAFGSPGCQYFQGGQGAEGGHCAVLNMQVSGPGHCNAFSAMSGGGDMQADQGMSPGMGGAPPMGGGPGPGMGGGAPPQGGGGYPGLS